jgi:hypothetical protein
MTDCRFLEEYDTVTVPRDDLVANPDAGFL